MVIPGEVDVVDFQLGLPDQLAGNMAREGCMQAFQK